MTNRCHSERSEEKNPCHVEPFFVILSVSEEKNPCHVEKRNCHVERSETSAEHVYKPSGDPSLTLRMTKGGAQDDSVFLPPFSRS